MIVIVTGASSGIGASLSVLLAQRGDFVVLVARRADALAEVALRCGSNAMTITADVSQRAEVQRIVRETIAQCGHIDVLVNNAGQGISRPPSQLTDDDVDLMMQVNVKSVLYGMQETLPHFKERGTGHVINISSMLGRVPFAMIRSAYSASKHYVNAITAIFRTEVQATHANIQYTLVSPGVVRTDFGLNAKHGGPDSRSLPYTQSAEEVAQVIADVMDSRRPDVYTRAGARDQVRKYYDATGEDP